MSFWILAHLSATTDHFYAAELALEGAAARYALVAKSRPLYSLL